MEKIINKLINEFTEGVDIYTYNGSTWLIFTESKQWIIELTKNKTLWFNFNFFNNIFSYVSLDVLKNQKYITKWVEDYVMNDEIYQTTVVWGSLHKELTQINDTIQNGVKRSRPRQYVTNTIIKDVISETHEDSYHHKDRVDGIIKLGSKVFGTFVGGKSQQDNVETIIKKGLE